MSVVGKNKLVKMSNCSVGKNHNSDIKELGCNIRYINLQML